MPPVSFISLVVLVGNIICGVDVPGSSWVSKIPALAKQEPDVDSYLGNPNDVNLSFFRLQPPPAVESFEFREDEFTVDNFDAVLRDVEKVKLKRVDVARKVFGTCPDTDKVYLYIEIPSGKYFTIWCLDVHC